MKLTLGGSFIALLAASASAPAAAFTPLSLQKQIGSVSIVDGITKRKRWETTKLYSTAEETDSKNVLYQRKPRPPYKPGVCEDPDYVRIFDTTLRDGEQSPGAPLTS